MLLSEGNSARHQWLIEFEKEPAVLEDFVSALDYMLKQVNSDYEAKRYKNMILSMPEVLVLSKGTFYAWLKEKNRLGGQYKVPRLANNRQHIEEILAVKL